ncbi:hypothetical protein [Micromonospora endophytica]|uniref:Uncharacterized protein n=1 Tax=Micromonospora endophytica TaxID=515350 RepID=A0A2W2DV48_9ACTN|nr:hypothetical protein [Micromonospora endophytica]PZG01047.1 hypothetical protein C1I93_00735 [Micromonospora endophytica]RIW47911.1 hypothetical protein D3H59_08515 [Micromonospora endophytica]BCJ62282.1 hypothetical protein Jiend_57040 [Micromonospora endophytica]
MTTHQDALFVAEVRAALAERIRSIDREATAGPDAWRELQHRALAERIKALAAATHRVNDPTGALDGVDLLGHATRLAVRLTELQGPSGLFTGGDNVDSPPDSAFSINDLADALLLLRHAENPVPGEPPLTQLLQRLLLAASPALTEGGVHTPNHRWEIAAALARLFLVTPQPAQADRVDQWLAEGIDIDDDGLYSERSANYAAHVSNPSLLTVASVFDRPDLVDAVERNLDATLDLLLPDGTVETVLSRRQDQNRPIPLADYLLPLRRVALLRGRGDLAWAAGLALEQGINAPTDAAARLVLDPDIADTLPAPVRPQRPRRRVFGAAGLLMVHQPSTTTVIFGGSDYPRHGRIRSGLANSPTFLRLFAGAAVLDSVRLSRVFFGKGPFRPEGLTVEWDATAEPAVLLAETVSASYYQPLNTADCDPRGDYRLGDEGRFSAAMDFDRRTRDDRVLNTAIRAQPTATGVELTVDLTGAVVDWTLEWAFRPGGVLTGARPIGVDRWQLDLPAAAEAGPVNASYQFGRDSITVSVLEASGGQDLPWSEAFSPPAYEPGEEYRFLGGTDAAAGPRLYLSGRVPARVRVHISAESAG